MFPIFFIGGLSKVLHKIANPSGKQERSKMQNTFGVYTWKKKIKCTYFAQFIQHKKIFQYLHHYWKLYIYNEMDNESLSTKCNPPLYDQVYAVKKKHLMWSFHMNSLINLTSRYCVDINHISSVECTNQNFR